MLLKKTKESLVDLSFVSEYLYVSGKGVTPGHGSCFTLTNKNILESFVFCFIFKRFPRKHKDWLSSRWTLVCLSRKATS